ncbi:MAG: GNAT family N-acetyltransferase [Acidobacteriota bacterium]|nr:GNAT family N-acetyltransferase [Blastocatellia bacterium]MDW8241527.1 GNAT family N-acetyltransferase [Acidobacteriota bacterium]
MNPFGPIAHFRIELATDADVPLILSLIKELAEYERLSHEVVATEEQLRNELFGERPVAEVIIGYVEDQPVGFALFFHNMSTFLGRRGLYLEDLYVKPEFRGRGFGRAMLVYLARLAVKRGCGRLEWAVLDWNEPAIRFYEKLGAVAMHEWTIYRLSGEALHRLAAQGAENQ